MEEILIDCFSSFYRVTAGFLAATLLGIILGILRSELPERLKRNWLIRFLIECTRFIPPIAWIPYAIFRFGLGEMAACSIVFVGGFWPVFSGAFEAAETVPQTIKQIGRSLELPWLKYLSQIIFPACLPKIFTSARIGIGTAWGAVIASEMVSGQSGLGYAIQTYRLNSDYDLMKLDMALIGFIGFLLYALLLIIEKKFAGWQERYLHHGRL
jgi:NitT/TauT family transport system permease protein